MNTSAWLLLVVNTTIVHLASHLMCVLKSESAFGLTRILWVFHNRKVHLVSHLMCVLKLESAFGLTSYECSKVRKCIWSHILSVSQKRKGIWSHISWAFLSWKVHLVSHLISVSEGKVHLASHLMCVLKLESAFGLTFYEFSEVEKCIWPHILCAFLSWKVHLASHLSSVSEGKVNLFLSRKVHLVSHRMSVLN